MNNIEKLYSELINSGLIKDTKLEDFMNGLENEDYLKAVYDNSVDQGLFTQDFDKFKSTYSMDANRKKVLSGFDDLDITDDEAKDEISFFEGAKRLVKNKIPYIEKIGRNLFELGTSYLEFMADEDTAAFFASGFDLDFDKDIRGDKRKSGLLDSETGEVVTFDNDAYKRDGHDAEENKRWYALVKKMQSVPRYRQTDRGREDYPNPVKNVKINKDGSTEDVEDLFAKYQAENHKKSLEAAAKMEKITDSDTFVEAVKKGRVGDILLKSTDFLAETGIQFGAAYVSGGTSMMAQMFGAAYSDFNDEKAKAIYGEDDPKAFEKLVANGQDQIGVPAAWGGLGYLLERVGFKGVTRAIAKKSFKGKNKAALLVAGNKEGVTEFAQGITERANINQGKGMSAKESADDIANYVTTEEAWDNYFAGLIGGGGMGAIQQQRIKSLRANQNSNIFINQKVDNLSILADRLAAAKTEKQRKKIKEDIQIEHNDLQEFLLQNKKLDEYLSEKQSEGLNSILENVNSTKKQIKDIQSLFKKGLVSKADADAQIAALTQKIERYDDGINKIRNDANMSMLQQDLDASGQLVKAMKGLEQEVYKTEQEFLDALKAKILEQGGTEQDFTNATQDKAGNKYAIDGLKVGNTLLVNAEVAAKRNATATGTHEVLHGLLKSTLQENDGSGNLSKDGEKIVNDFLNTLSKSERKALDKRLDAGNYKKNKDGTEKEFKEYGEEYINFYAQLSKEDKLNVSKVGKFLGNLFRNKTEFKQISFETGTDTRAFLDAMVADSKKGIYRKEISDFAAQQDLTGDTTVKASMTANQKAEVKQQVDNLGSQSELGDNFREEGVGKFLYDAEVDNVISKIKNEGYLDGLIASKFKGDRVPRDFVSQVVTELTSHIKNFNPETNDSLFGWINSQLANKAGNVYNREYKATQTDAGRARDIGETTQEGEVKVQVAADTDTALEALETEDLSIGAQKKSKAEVAEKTSRFRRALGFQTGGEIYSKVLDAASKSIRLAYRKTQGVKDKAKRAVAIREAIRKEYFTKGLTSDLFKPIKDFLGAKTYIKNLKEHREAIVNFISTADFVQIERKVNDNERIFTVFDKQLTSKKDVQDAVNRDLLPLEALNKIDKGQAVNLYRKRMPTEAEFIGFADQPAINPETGARSGLKGTRKDGFAKAIANTLILDATMEVRQSEDVVDALDNDVSDLMELSAAIGREVDIKFSKSTAVVDINKAIDSNVNVAVYSQIRFSRSHREAYEARLAKKRTDLSEKQIKGAVESIFKFVDGENIPNNKKSKYEKLAMHYMANGFLILPEDGYKVMEADRIATIKKIDPFSYKNPNELIERFVGEVKGARTNPDTVEEFTNKNTLSKGVTVYDVADSKEGQLAVRKVIDTHFGKKANPWCLAARDSRIDQEYGEFFDREEAERFADELKERGFVVETFSRESDNSYEVYGDLMAKPGSNTELDAAFKAWKRYNKEGNGFKIAFKNNKLLCFRDGNKKQWWDRNDKASDKIHFVVKEKKGDVESTFSVVPEDGTKTLTKRIKGKMPTAEVFTSREDAYFNIKSNTTYVNGLITKQKVETTYKDSKSSTGVYVSAISLQKGQLYAKDEIGVLDIEVNKITKDIETIDGDILTKELDGKVVLASGPYKVYEDVDKVKIVHVTDVRTGETKSITVNGIPHQADVKFSKSTAEVNYNKTLSSIKFSRKKQDPYIADQLNTARELGNTSDEIIYARLEQELNNGTPLQEAHAVAFKEAYGDQAAEIIQQDGNSVENLQENINKFYLPKVRAFAKDVALKKYAKLIKATKDTEAQQDLINSFLINYGRPIRSGKVLNITTNRALLVEMEKAFGEEAMRPYELVPVDSGEKVMVNGKDIDLYKSITPIKSNPARYANKVNEQASLAKKFLFEDVLQDDNLSNGEKKALVQLMFYGQKGPGRKLYKLGAYVEGMPVSKTTLEHEITANDMHNAIIDVIDGKMDIDKLSDIIDNAYVHVLPKEINNIFKKLGKTSKRNLQGYESMPEVLEYLQTLDLKGNTVTLDFSRTKEIRVVTNAIQFSRSTKNPTKGISILDFDDTLATSKSLVKFTRPDGTKGTLTPAQYASTYESLSDLGYEFDFSEFSKVVDGKPAPLLNKAKKLAGKFGTKDMFVLTARPADSALAIKEFLKQNGLDIPLKNITGLGNSTAEAKALWVANKVADGYNDFYFADDALKNVQAVQNMLDQFDVKSKVQQARIKFSRSLDKDFNSIIETLTGIEANKRFSDVKARKRGASKGKFRYFIPPSHEDFVGLLYNFMGKGAEGNRHRDFFERALVRPLNRAYRELDTAKQSIANDFKALNKKFPDIKKKLKKNTADGDFTFEDAIRVYIWDKNEHDIPGLSKKDKEMLLEYVKLDPVLEQYANTIEQISRVEGYIPPVESWEAGDIKTDLMDATGKVGRDQYFNEFNENAAEIFSKDNLNKIEAGYGRSVREALKDMLYSIQTGQRRPQGQNKIVNAFVNFINASVGTVMFFNMRSALLQQMSIVNYMNFADNNLFAMAKAFANQKQYWTDWAMIFNSDMLKQRRGGIQTDVNGAELVQTVTKSKFPMRSVIKKLLAIGFTPTQIGDSIAISTGGSTFYRNRVNRYLKDGLTKEQAEKAAFNDFNEITQATQQSAREDMISQQQRSAAGKFILAFQNVTSQFNRLGKKAFSDLKNRRITKPNETQLQSDISNVARLTYYIGIQNMLFYSLQTALFMAMFDDDEELTDKEKKSRDKKYEYAVNGAIDSVLRGTGVYGAIVATVKNMAIKWKQQRDKKYDKDESAVLMAALDVSPPLGIKARRIVSAEKTLNYNEDAIKHMELSDIDNPIWPAVTSYAELVNIPLNKTYNKVQNIRQSLNDEHQDLERVMMFFGWSQYNLGLENTKMEGIEQDIKDKERKDKNSKFEAQQREELRRARKGQMDVNKITCSAAVSSGARCKRKPVSKGKCTIHQEVELSKDRKQKQCRKIKSDGSRCKMMTQSKNQLCYYHD